MSTSNNDQKQNQTNHVNQVKGYKIFGPDYTYNNYKYSINEPNICQTNKFDFCQQAVDCLQYNSLDKQNTYAEVVGYDCIVDNDEVQCSVINVKPMSMEEFAKLCTGTIKTYYTNGRPKMEITYENGQEHGVCKKYHFDNNKLKEEINYKNGKQHGKYKSWVETDIYYLREETDYVDDNIHGISRTYYHTGQIICMCTYKNNRKHGKCVVWHDNGKIKSICNYVNDVLNGNYKEWDENGDLVKNVEYADACLI